MKESPNLTSTVSIGMNWNLLRRCRISRGRTPAWSRRENGILSPSCHPLSANGRVVDSFQAGDQGALLRLFATVALVTIGAGILLAMLVPFIKKLTPRSN